MIEVACGIIRRSGRVLAVQRGPGMRHPGKWEVPGGKREPGETLQECLHRELHEELAISVKILAALPEIDETSGDRLIRFSPFVVELIGGDPILREHAQLRWCLPDELAPLAWLSADVAIVEAYQRWIRHRTE